MYESFGGSMKNFFPTGEHLEIGSELLAIFDVWGAEIKGSAGIDEY